MRSKAEAEVVRRSGSNAGALRRFGRNFGWLAGSTAFSAVASLVYVGLTARALGASGFGAFALVMTYGELVANLFQFQSWKAVIGFGATHKTSDGGARLARLFGFAGALDGIGAIVGALFAIAAVPLTARFLHWDPSQQKAAQWFATVLLLTSSTAPAGMLRLFDRFDLQAYTETIAQIIRLLGCLIGWAIGAGVLWFLCVWATAALAQLLSQWLCVLALGYRPAFGARSLRLARRENLGLFSFMVKTNLSSSLSWLWMQCGTLVVGARAGPVEAGGFRLAHRFSLALMKPIEIATKALLPEFARFVANGDDQAIRRVIVRVTLVSTGLGLVMLAAAGLLGREILHLAAGRDFEFASGFLFLLSIAAAINLAGFALEPFHNAEFRPGIVLRSYAVATLVYGGLLAALLASYGAKAAAFASIGAAVALLLQLGVSAVKMVGAGRRPSDLPAGIELA